MGSDDLYSRSTSTNNTFYSDSVRTISSEPNMRQELINMLDGNVAEIAKARKMIFRKMNRDSNGRRTLCDCVDLITKEADKDRLCISCLGSGYIWTETLIEAYKMLEDSNKNNARIDRLAQFGYSNQPLVVFYTKYNVDISIGDKLIEIKLNHDGTIYTPYTREHIYNTSSFMDYRCDNGKLEYMKIFTHHEDVKYLNIPDYEDA
jgi:hypothetical protein